MLGVGAALLLCTLCQLLFESGGQAECPLGALAELPLAMRRGAQATRTEAKRRRLASLAGLGGISDNALVKVLAAVREEPELLTEAISHTMIARGHDEVWESVGGTDELQLKDGGTFTWFHSRPSAVLNCSGDVFCFFNIFRI